ncbi:MAG: hypothetical protein AB7S99_05050 [Pseudodonghicola sp.]
MTRTISDLNDHLFAQLERMSADKMSAEEIEREAKRADAIVSLADKIAANASLQLKAAQLFANHGKGVLPMLPQIGGPKE